MSKLEPFTSNKLFCPGPTPVPEVVRAAMAETSIYHRSQDFYSIFQECSQLLQPIFGSSNSPIILTSSGSGAMEAAVVNLTNPGDQVVAVRAGKFGERWVKINEQYENKVEVLEIPWGNAPDATALNAAISASGASVLFLQANETSTGVRFPLEDIIPEVRKTFNGLIVVDAISSIGSHKMEMDRLQIDAVVAGSQKGFGIPPGLAFIALSDRAWNMLSNRPRFYFDLAKERKGQQEGRSAWTPASTLILGLHSALKIIHELGIDQWVAHHKRLAKGTRAAVESMGLELFPEATPSDAVTAIKMPANVDGQKVVARVRNRFGGYIAGGQDDLKGKIVRIAHLGFVSVLDQIQAIAALEMALADEGAAISTGEGVKAALQTFQSLD